MLIFFSSNLEHVIGRRLKSCVSPNHDLAAPRKCRNYYQSVCDISLIEYESRNIKFLKAGARKAYSDSGNCPKLVEKRRGRRGPLYTCVSEAQTLPSILH